VATNLRLDQAAAAALRAAAKERGRSQQDLLREAVARFLGLDVEGGSRERAVTAGLVKPPAPFQDVVPSIKLRRGVSTADLLGRDDER
jgi:hypothetical protein